MPKRSTVSLASLLMASAQVAFNDNAARFMLVGLGQAVLPEKHAALLVSALGAILIAPFVLLAPFVGWISDHYSKQKVLKWALVLQIGVMLWITVALAARSLPMAVAGFALLSVQACFYSPAKQGILKELVGEEKLGMAAGWMGGISVLAILLGMVTGGVAFDRLADAARSPWTGALQAGAWLTGGSILALIAFFGVEHTRALSPEKFSRDILTSHFRFVAELWRETPLRLTALGIAYFWAFGGVVNLSVIQIGRDLHAGAIGSTSESVLLLFVIGLGMAVGSLAAAGLCRGRIELGLVPIGAAGLLVSILACGLASLGTPFFKGSLFALGFSAGLFTVPLNAYFQAKAEDAKRGRRTAALTLLVDTGGLVAIAVQYALAEGLDLSAPQQFLVMSLPSIAVAAYVLWLLPESLLRLSGIVIARGIYKVRARGLEHLPREGGVLLISNHVSYVDAVVLQLACPRPIRFVAYEGFHKSWWLGWALRILQVIPISSKRAKDAVREVGQELQKGEVVCVFPEGQLTRTGTLQGLRRGFELMAREGGAPVVPVFLDSLWESIFAFSDRKFFWKLPRRWPYGILVNFGEPIPAGEARAVRCWQALLDLGEECFQERPELRDHLGYACLRRLAVAPWKTLVIERFPQPRRISRGAALALAIVLSRRWRASIAEKRVGVVLPPGIGGIVANLALILAGKIPVNLNFTAGRGPLESCLRRAGIETVISAELLRKKIKDFPWPERTIDAAAEIAACRRSDILLAAAAVWLLPAPALARRLGLPRQADHEEAALLFTSGSSGDPKGVVLTHRNILGNVSQFAATSVIGRGERLLGCLPLFHSFGFTVTLWYPLLRGVELVTVPSPLETQKIGEAMKEENVAVLLSTPTFLRAYLRKLEPGAFTSLKLAVAGAEKTPPDLARAFHDKYGIPLLEGYGLTETSPAVSVNIPGPADVPQIGIRPGSVGRLLPGITARIVDPETGEPKIPTETGMLHLRGPNIFAGYLGDPERTAEVLRDGWFITGDLARFDEDGFLFIEGRLSRFSKIGGEMVPHGSVEQKIIEAFGLADAESQAVVVVGVPDEAKGEAIVALTTADLAADAVREKLSAAGLPNLWIPKWVVRVEKIPTLASGKIDLKACQSAAGKK